MDESGPDGSLHRGGHVPGAVRKSPSCGDMLIRAIQFTV